MKKWDEQNILYNSLWFYVNKGVDVEYHPGIPTEYKKLTFFESNNWIRINKNKGEALCPLNFKTFSADIMTGWWVPFKCLISTSNTITRKEIEDILHEIPNRKEPISGTLSLEEIDELTDQLKKAAQTTELCKWFQKQNQDIKVEHIFAFLKFLKTVYSIGNIIPAPENLSTGRYGLDSWQHKLCWRINQGVGSSEKWNHYIASCFSSNWKSFIELNFLSPYFEDEEYKMAKTFWPKDRNLRLNSACGATLEDWEHYLSNATECINERSAAIKMVINPPIKK